MKLKNIRLAVFSILLTSFAVSIGAVALIYLNSVQGGLLTADVEDRQAIEPDDDVQVNSNDGEPDQNSTSDSPGAAEVKADDSAVIASKRTRRPTNKNAEKKSVQSDKLDKPAEETSLEQFPSGTFDDIASKAETNEFNDAPANTRPWKSKTTSDSKTKASDKTTAKLADEKLASKKESESDADEDDTKLEALNSIHGKEIVKSFRAKCVACLDGDTLTVWDGKDRIRIRLQSIDTPESAQAYGQKAKQALSKLVFGKNVTVHSTGQDDYGRTLAFIVYRRSNIAERMVELGMAWHYTQYSDSETLNALEQKARRKKVGLWADKNPTAPWTWRRAEKAKEARKNQ